MKYRWVLVGAVGALLVGYVPVASADDGLSEIALAAVGEADPQESTRPGVSGTVVTADEFDVDIVGADSRGRVTEDSVQYPNGDVTYVARALDDGGQVLAVQHEPEVGELSYEYQFEGKFLEMSEDGVIIRDGGPTGEPVGLVEPAWALDAQGQDLPTAYEVVGDTLIQTVQADESTSFPVVSDPKWATYWWGFSVDFSKSETIAIAAGASGCAQVASSIPSKYSMLIRTLCTAVIAHAGIAKAQGKCVSARWLIAGAMIYPWIRSC